MPGTLAQQLHIDSPILMAPMAGEAAKAPLVAAGGIADGRGVRNRYVDEMRAFEDGAPAYPVTNARNWSVAQLMEELRTGLALQ